MTTIEIPNENDGETGVTRLVNWRRYQKAVGYDVEVTVTYTRTRKVRAESKKQAKEFAIEREARSAEKMSTSKGSMGYSLNKVVSGKATLVSDREDDDG